MRSTREQTTSRATEAIIAPRPVDCGPTYRVTLQPGQQNTRDYVVKFSPVPSPRPSKEVLRLGPTTTTTTTTQRIKSSPRVTTLRSAITKAIKTADNREGGENQPGPSVGSRIGERNQIEVYHHKESHEEEVEVWGLGTRIVDSIILVVSGRDGGPRSRRGNPGRTRRRRRRRQRTAIIRRGAAEMDTTGSEESFYEVNDVVYEPITGVETTELPRNWRIFPRYELTGKEAAQQETELYLSMTQECRPEEGRAVSEGQLACCVCWENAATRVVIPCGHRCLCYPCAFNIATNRSIFGGSRLPKLCPICQAAIGIMPRLC